MNTVASISDVEITRTILEELVGARHAQKEQVMDTGSSCANSPPQQQTAVN